LVYHCRFVKHYAHVDDIFCNTVVWRTKGVTAIPAPINRVGKNDNNNGASQKIQSG